MVLSIITLAATVPLLATSTIQLQDQSQKTRDDNELELKTEKCHLLVRATARMSQRRREQLQDMVVVLREGRLLLEKDGQVKHHPFTGYFLPFPGSNHDGIVSTINAENMLNWIFVDKDTYELRYGVRTDAQSQITGPMSLLSLNGDEWHIAFDGWEGFVAVEGAGGVWSVFLDKNDNGLLLEKGKGKSVVEIELLRSPLVERDATDAD